MEELEVLEQPAKFSEKEMDEKVKEKEEEISGGFSGNFWMNLVT